MIVSPGVEKSAVDGIAGGRKGPGVIGARHSLSLGEETSKGVDPGISVTVRAEFQRSVGTGAPKASGARVPSRVYSEVAIGVGAGVGYSTIDGVAGGEIRRDIVRVAHSLAFGGVGSKCIDPGVFILVDAGIPITFGAGIGKCAGEGAGVLNDHIGSNRVDGVAVGILFGGAVIGAGLTSGAVGVLSLEAIGVSGTVFGNGVIGAVIVGTAETNARLLGTGVSTVTDA